MLDKFYIWDTVYELISSITMSFSGRDRTAHFTFFLVKIQLTIYVAGKAGENWRLCLIFNSLY